MDRIGITVLMAVWKGDDPASLKKSLQSIVSQSMPPISTLVGVDGQVSSDLNDVLFWASERGFTVVRFDNNRGLAWVLNDLLKLVETEFIARLDPDDECLPHRFELQHELMVTDPQLAVLGGAVVFIEGDNKRVRKYPTGNNEIHRVCKYRNPIAHPTVLIRTRVMRETSGYPLFNRCQDWALWGSLMLRGYKFANLADPVVRYSAGEDYSVKRDFSYMNHELAVIDYFKDIGFLNRKEWIVSKSMRIIGRATLKFVSKIKF